MSKIRPELEQRINEEYIKFRKQYDEILNNEGDIFEANISDKPINTCFGIDVYEVDGELLSEQEYAKTL